MFGFGLGVIVTTALARGAHDNICDQAARSAARQLDIPVEIMLALTRTETGRARNGRLEPWPWTANSKGVGHWFSSRDEALAFAYESYKSGQRSFDLGCFQINFRWHGSKFASLNEMIDPQANANYAASFLRALFEETGDWRLAAAAYHSRTPEFAQKYRLRFERILASLNRSTSPSLPQSTESLTPVKKLNNFPFLVTQESTKSRLGSLVPMTGRASGALWFQIGNSS